MAKANKSPFATVQQAAQFYIDRGWQVVPLSEGTKQCRDTNWLKLVFNSSDFLPNDNIGLRSTNGLVDVDCDAPEVVACASEFLPPTPCIYGRANKPRAHWLYASTFDKPIAFKDMVSGGRNAATLIEIRVNHQSMAPPSKHPDGQVIEWEGTPGVLEPMEPETLLRAVRLTATCGLMSRYYNPPGDRHDWGLALAGVLHRFGVSEEEAIKLFTSAAKWAKDSEVKDRLSAVRTTFNRGDDDPIKSTKALKDAMPDKGALFVTSLQRIWGSAGSAFIVDEKTHKPIANSQENIRRALDKLEVKLFYDEFSSKPQIVYGGYTGILQDSYVNRIWLTIDEKFGFRPTTEFFDIVMQDIALKNKVHPVRDYLDKLKWDGVKRLDTWLSTYGGAADTKYTRAVGRIVLIAAVRRVRHPGCKFDELMILESDQGKLKSSALKALCPNEDWFSDDLPLNVSAKEIIEGTQGKWIIEAAELSGMRANQTEHLKALLSRQTDGPVRMAYARMPIERQRQFIIVGTTNSHQYLNDSTGNRRFWPVRVELFDVVGIARDRDQLWAEASALEASGESIRLDPSLHEMAALQQERRRFEDPWEDTFANEFPRTDAHRVPPNKLWALVAVGADKRTPQLNQRISAIMQRLGFRKGTVRDPDNDNKPVKGWIREVEEGQTEMDYDR